MKQFDLQEYLKDPGRKIVTRNGRKARVICTDRNSDNRPVVVLVQGSVSENAYCYTRDGLFYGDTETPGDLFFEPTKKTGWINLYDLRGKIVCGVVYASEKAARGEIDQNKSYITTIPIEWEE